jgi:hypothetical protein
VKLQEQDAVLQAVQKAMFERRAVTGTHAESDGEEWSDTD